MTDKTLIIVPAIIGGLSVLLGVYHFIIRDAVVGKGYEGTVSNAFGNLMDPSKFDGGSSKTYKNHKRKHNKTKRS